MRAGGMSAGDLHVEVTETAVLEDNVDMLDVLSRLRLKGIALSIDDFGTGFSSLRGLKRVPYTEIKIDRSFINDLTISRDALAIVKSIIDLAKNMRITCAAEGVTREDAADLLEQLGVTALQGNLFAEPMPAEAVPAWWAMWRRDDPPNPHQIAEVEKLRPPGPMSALGEVPQTAAASHREPGTAAPRLPHRQSQVMRLVAEGFTVKEIARRLQLSVGTVKVHLALAYTTLGARNRIEAIRRLGALGEPPIGKDSTATDEVAPTGQKNTANTP